MQCDSAQESLDVSGVYLCVTDMQWFKKPLPVLPDDAPVSLACWEERLPSFLSKASAERSVGDLRSRKTYMF